MKNLFSSLLVAGLLISCSGSDTQADKNNDEKLSGQEQKDARSVVDIYSDNMLEMATSELALNKASIAEVKKLAENMLTEHSKLKTEIEASASSHQIDLPGSLNDDQSRQIEQLNDKKGIEFDDAYISKLKDAHQHSIDECKKVAKHSDNGSLKDWANSLKPRLENHLDMVKTAENMVKEVRKSLKENSAAADHSVIAH